MQNFENETNKRRRTAAENNDHVRNQKKIKNNVPEVLNNDEVKERVIYYEDSVSQRFLNNQSFDENHRYSLYGVPNCNSTIIGKPLPVDEDNNNYMPKYFFQSSSSNSDMQRSMFFTQGGQNFECSHRSEYEETFNQDFDMSEEINYNSYIPELQKGNLNPHGVTDSMLHDG